MEFLKNVARCRADPGRNGAVYDVRRQDSWLRFLTFVDDELKHELDSGRLFKADSGMLAVELYGAAYLASYIADDEAEHQRKIILAKADKAAGGSGTGAFAVGYNPAS